MNPTRVLVTGATGFVGGSVLTHILSIEALASQIAVTAIVRRIEQVDALARFGIRAVVFDGLDDTVQLQKIASQFDIVVHCATGLHTPSARALILGLGDSMHESGRQCHYIHTTGTSNLAYGTISHPNATIRDFKDAEDSVYDEEVRRDVQQLYNQRKTDLVAVETAEQTGVRLYLMMPPTIYGRGLGAFKSQSHQVPAVIRHALDAGRPEYIGGGTGTVGYVHIADLSALYALLLNKIMSGADLPHGRRGYYFSNTGSFTWKALSEKVGEIGFRLGLLKDATPVSRTLEEAQVKWGYSKDEMLLLETNFAAKSMTTPQNAIMLGWSPAKTAADWEIEIEETWKAVQAEREM